MTTAAAALERLAADGAVTKVPGINGNAYSATTWVGEYAGRSYTLAATVFVYANAPARVKADVIHDGKLVKRPPLQANWPVMKAVREIADGNQSEEVILRLLNAAF